MHTFYIFSLSSTLHRLREVERRQEEQLQRREEEMRRRLASVAAKHDRNTTFIPRLDARSDSMATPSGFYSGRGRGGGESSDDGSEPTSRRRSSSSRGSSNGTSKRSLLPTLRSQSAQNVAHKGTAHTFGTLHSKRLSPGHDTDCGQNNGESDNDADSLEQRDQRTSAAKERGTEAPKVPGEDEWSEDGPDLKPYLPVDNADDSLRGAGGAVALNVQAGGRVDHRVVSSTALMASNGNSADKKCRELEIRRFKGSEHASRVSEITVEERAGVNPGAYMGTRDQYSGAGKSAVRAYPHVRAAISREGSSSRQSNDSRQGRREVKTGDADNSGSSSSGRIVKNAVVSHSQNSIVLPLLAQAAPPKVKPVAPTAVLLSEMEVKRVAQLGMQYNYHGDTADDSSPLSSPSHSACAGRAHIGQVGGRSPKKQKPFRKLKPIPISTAYQPVTHNIMD